MNITQATALRDALEEALLSGAGVASVQVGDRTVTYQTPAQAKSALAQINRDIAAYARRVSGVNPSVSRPRWR